MTKPAHFWILPVSLLTGLILLLPGGLVAQDEEEEDEFEFEPSTEEVLEFLEEKMPESIALLERIRKEESVEDYQEVLERAAEILIEYHYLNEDGNDAMAVLFVEINRVEIQIESAIEAWHDAENEKERKAARADLKSKISKHFDLELEFGRLELDALKAEVESIEKEIAEVEAEREELIEEEVEEALEGDEDEDEEDEDEDEDEE